MAFLPTLQVGGMQIFRTEGFDTLGKILPRARDMAEQVFSLYLILTLLCAMVYAACGMSAFEALCHAMTTLATGGFSTSDSSFAAFSASAQYAGAIFMLLGSLPYARYVQLAGGDAKPLLSDPQVRGFLIVAAGRGGARPLWPLRGEP